MATNRLIHEKSPYLLQHAHNPVDWYAWGEEAFAKARTEGKPIFLSIGYSTCHWCHVMERESFENEKTAEILNRHFVPIKLDREERPDVDRVYMTFVQATTGGGGWPLSVWLTPELKPFYGGTYFPPDDRYGRASFPRVLMRLAEAWRDERPRLEQAAAGIVAELERHTSVEQGSGGVREQAPQRCFEAFRHLYDARHGGFGTAPKFPRPAVLHFLLRYHNATGNAEAREMALATLDAMARGGIRDQLGGGFHRYSVDERWRVPHFEKMLYDQAQLLDAYVEAFQISGEQRFAEVAREVANYVVQELVEVGGGFHSAEDADSEGREGAFYVWSEDELRAVLGQERAAWFASRFGCEEGVLYQTGSIDWQDKAFVECRRLLLEARGRRARPHRDDKVLASWNGLMISALARAGGVLGERRYTVAAVRAFEFIELKLGSAASGSLKRSWRDGEARIEAMLDDYAAIALAALDLYEFTGDDTFRAQGVAAVRQMVKRFADQEHGGFYSAPREHTDLVLRMKEDYDGAEPSGSTLAIEALLRAGEREAAVGALAAFASRLNTQPEMLPRMMSAYLMSMGSESVLTLRGAAAELAAEFHRHFQPFTRIEWQPGDGAVAELCRGHVCLPAATSVTELRELLN